MLTGKLLVATPMLTDPNFARTVVLLLEHNDDGALGLVINRPTEVAVAETLEEWAPVAGTPRVVFAGGPVQPSAAIAVARTWSTEPSEGWRPFEGRMGTIDISRTPADLDVAVEVLRLFAGYAGWSAGQLEGEIAGGAWYVVGARPDDCFSTEPERLWREVLRRQGGKLAMVSTFPDDPQIN